MKPFKPSKIDVRTNGSVYPVYIGRDIYTHLAHLIEKHQVNRQIAIISTSPVSQHYLSHVRAAFDQNWHVIHYDIPDGELSKSADVCGQIYTWLIQNHFERNSTILALGGGVVGDLAGFAAATYLRGINLVHCPTSLLAQVDSSIGGKVGINHELGKNLIGAFYQPRLVITDISVLKTLDDQEYLCGLGEVLKYAIIAGGRFFEVLEQKAELVLQRDIKIEEDIIRRCIRLKRDIVEQDVYESGIRVHLNLGHTFGHALETYFSYQQMKHGHAVLLGLYCAVQASQSLNLLHTEDALRIKKVLDRFVIPLPASITDSNVDDLHQIIRRDKKIRGGMIQMIAIRGIGRVERIAVSEDVLKTAFKSLDLVT